jgi:hypothetical protein
MGDLAGVLAEVERRITTEAHQLFIEQLLCHHPN